MKNGIFGKGLVCGIIVLFLGMSIMPMAGSLSVEKHSSILGSVKELNTMTKAESRDIYVILHGELGENGWYIGIDFWIEIIATNGTEIVRVEYNLDGSGWVEYTGPWTWTIDPNGIHPLGVRVYDQYGNPWYFSFEIKIDTTPPTIMLHKQIMFLNKIKFIADVSDLPSGIWRVEFYLDDELQFTDYDFPFEWTYEGSGNHMVTATVFDMAGNSASSSISTPYAKSLSQNLLHLNQLFLKLLERFPHTFPILRQLLEL